MPATKVAESSSSGWWGKVGVVGWCGCFSGWFVSDKSAAGGQLLGTGKYSFVASFLWQEERLKGGGKPPDLGLACVGGWVYGHVAIYIAALIPRAVDVDLIDLFFMPTRITRRRRCCSHV